MRILTCMQMKDAEHRSGDYGISLLRLMENAGSAAANFIRKNGAIEGKNCLILCGKGNNG